MTMDATKPPRKKLIEVSLPLEAINAASAREKSIRHGHPSTLHLWWARRPLAACRAVLFASLVDDPESDPEAEKLSGEAREHWIGAERQRLHDLIAELVKWESSNDPKVIGAARAEIARCVASRKVETGEWAADAEPVAGGRARDFVARRAGPEAVDALLAAHAPPVYDPFCGGGSIPLEAQRLGLRAFASDLNPVPVLITKALIELPPKFAGRPPVNPESRRQQSRHADWSGARGLAEDVRYYGRWMRNEAEKRIGHLYPKVTVTPEMAEGRPDLKPYVGQELTVIAWIWARTVASPNPAANGVHVPLVKSFWLSTKKAKEAWVNPVVDANSISYRFDVRVGQGRPQEGTVGRRGGVCLLTGTPIPFDHIRNEGKSNRLGVRLMAIVAEGNNKRIFLNPIQEHESIALTASPDWTPTTDLPAQALGFRVQGYGLTKHADLFTKRQLASLATFSGLAGKAKEAVLHDAMGCLNDSEEHGIAISTYLAFLVDQLANHNSNLCGWNSVNTQMRTVFSRNALSMTWDFAESNPFCKSSGSFHSLFERQVKGFTALVANGTGKVRQRDAQQIADLESDVIFCTDPPYYDNVPYADMSDFLYVWLRNSLSSSYSDLLSTMLVPKTQELVAEPYRHGGQDSAREFFETGMRQVFRRMSLSAHPDYPFTVFYAFKQSEEDDDSSETESDGTPNVASTGWETMLQGLVDSNMLVSGTWPVRTEGTGRMREIGSNALASSIVLVCHPRTPDAPVATRRDFQSILRRELFGALRNLQIANTAPVDLAQASIGPGMAVFSRYAKVVEADGSPMTVRTALQLINQALDEVLAEQEGEFDADTRWAIAWFEQYGVEEGPFGQADVLSRAKNTSVEGLKHAGIVAARGGKVRLLRRDELPEGYDPAADPRRTVWEVTQHLIRALDQQGEQGAADLLRKVGDAGEVARDLAYRLYTTCERKKWAQEALAYNSLVIAWPQVSKLARSAAAPSAAGQGTFDYGDAGSGG